MNNNVDGSTNPLPARTDPSISSTGRIRAIPLAFKHIQANSCKTPGCLNFGVPPRAGPIKIGRGLSTDNYAIVNTGSFTLACRLCGKSSTLKNNAAIHQEMIRQGDRLWDTPGLRCRDEACAGADPAFADFRQYGSTKSGSPRFQCRACGSTISIGKPTLRQPQAYKNARVFELLVNKVPLNRICEISGLEFTSLYRKIDFIYDQCRAFSADRERRLASRLSGSSPSP